MGSDSHPHPSLASLNRPLDSLSGIGPARARRLAEAGYRTLGDLLFHLPRRWEDRRHLQPAGRVEPPGPATVEGRLEGLRLIRTRRRGLTLVRGRLADDSGEVPVVWFNRPYLARQVRPGATYRLHGTVRAVGEHRRELSNPSLVEVTDEAPLEGVVPVYPDIPGLGPAALKKLIEQALEAVDLRHLPDGLDPELLKRYSLAPLGEALATLHRPGDEVASADLDARRTPAHHRLIFGELLRLRLAIALARQRRKESSKELRYRFEAGFLESFRIRLPFAFTGAQTRCAGEILGEMAEDHPMCRLLQGDVGSGKTVVAAAALEAALESGFQAALMAPTELLAEQHFQTLRGLLGDDRPITLLTASATDGEERRRALEAGEAALVVGTHALIQETVRFARLALVVIDEQHRFGVAQRRLLEEKGQRPDILVMTATPIPRSLALTVYGDLSLSLLDELPPGRRPVETQVVPTRQRSAVYRQVLRELDDGGQAFVVLPLIEESQQMAAASLAAEEERIRSWLSPHPCAILHGRMPAEERLSRMAAFEAGEIRALIATTVVEVGVDVPDASAMVIESAERFGLAQLHQLRGRVGRGERPSTCFAVHGKLTDEARRRLTVFAETTDGFRIAEADLAIRGPGELLGLRQAGIAGLRAADLAADGDWLDRAGEEAERLSAGRASEDLQALLESLPGPFLAAARDLFEA